VIIQGGAAAAVATMTAPNALRFPVSLLLGVDEVVGVGDLGIQLVLEQDVVLA
jgi:hypothetical protein